LKEMGLPLVETSEAIGSERLHDADVHESVVVIHEGFTVDGDEIAEAVKIVVQQFLAKLGRQIGLAVVEQRRDVVLQRALATTLVVEEKRLAVAEHYVPRLEIPVKKVILTSCQQEFRETAEIALQRLLIEGYGGETEKIVLEVVEIPIDGLAIEAGAGVANRVVEVTTRFDLKTRQRGYNFAVNLYCWRSNDGAVAICAEEVVKSCVAQVFFKVGALAKVFAVDLGDGQAVEAEVAGEFEEGYILLANGAENSDGGSISGGEADNGAA